MLDCDITSLNCQLTKPQLRIGCSRSGYKSQNHTSLKTISKPQHISSRRFTEGGHANLEIHVNFYTKKKRKSILIVMTKLKIKLR